MLSRIEEPPYSLIEDSGFGACRHISRSLLTAWPTSLPWEGYPTLVGKRGESSMDSKPARSFAGFLPMYPNSKSTETPTYCGNTDRQ